MRKKCNHTIELRGGFPYCAECRSWLSTRKAIRHLLSRIEELEELLSLEEWDDEYAG